MPDASPTAQDILADHAASAWLRSALKSALERDPVDALNDALVLAAALDMHLRTELGLEMSGVGKTAAERRNATRRTV